MELRALFALAEAYGIAGYLQFDASCIRGLSYYTGARGTPVLWLLRLSMYPGSLTVLLSPLPTRQPHPTAMWSDPPCAGSLLAPLLGQYPTRTRCALAWCL